MAIYISDSNGILKKVAGAGGGSSGESIIVDSVLNSESTNPVQNRIITGALDNKVDKVDGKDLSTNDYTTEDKNKVATIGNKVDKIDGKELSTNDFTTEEKDKLNAINLEANEFAENEKQKTLNMFNEADITRGVSLSSADGSGLVDSLWYVSDYIDVRGLSGVLIEGNRDSGQSNCFYDESKNFISTYKAIKGYIPVPSNAVYMRINGLISQLGEGYTNITQGDIIHEDTIQGMAGVELWNNPNKSSSFSAQTITLSNSFANFDYLILEYEAYVQTNGVVNCRAYNYFRPMGGGSLEVLSGSWDNGERHIKARVFKFISETQIEVASGYQEGTSNDRMVVPMRIYGIKKGV